MRKITSEAVTAFEAGQDYSNTNTKVVFGLDKITRLSLHGSVIAQTIYRDAKDIKITLAGWNTNTTRERLNGLQGVRVTTKQGQAYLNGKEWNGEWITIVR